MGPLGGGEKVGRSNRIERERKGGQGLNSAERGRKKKIPFERKKRYGKSLFTLSLSFGADSFMNALPHECALEAYSSS